MSEKPTIKIDLTNKKCKYSLVMAVISRAKELNRQARDRNLPVKEVSYSNASYTKAVTLALDEIRNDKVVLVQRKNRGESEREKPLAQTEDATQSPSVISAEGNVGLLATS